MPNRSRGIYDEATLSNSVAETVRTFCNSKGIPVVEGYRPGIGAAVGPSTPLEQLLRAIPLVGKAVVAALALGKTAYRKLTAYRRKRLRPFDPSVGVHLDIWPKKGLRNRGDSADLSDVLLLLHPLSVELSSSHSGVKTSFLVTGNTERVNLPPVQVDGDACSEASMVKLSARIRKDIAHPNSHTHFVMSNHLGIWPKISAFNDNDAAFRMVHLFPDSRT